MKGFVSRTALPGCIGLALVLPAKGEEAAVPDFDATFEVTAATDYFDSGLTRTDHKGAIQPMVSFWYGAFYGSVWGSNVDFGTDLPDAELEFVAGVAPEVGPWSFDLSAVRYEYPGDADREYTYVFASATHNFDSGLSLGAGYAYYWYDTSSDYNELYGSIGYELASGLALSGEANYDIDYDGAGNDYLGLEGGIAVPLPFGLEASANLGWEGYLTDRRSPSYYWYDAGVSYGLTDWASIDLRYHGNTLSRRDCPVYTETGCAGRVVASLTVSQSLSSLRPRAEPAQPLQPERPLADR